MAGDGNILIGKVKIENTWAIKHLKHVAYSCLAVTTIPQLFLIKWHILTTSIDNTYKPSGNNPSDYRTNKDFNRKNYSEIIQL